MAQPAFNAAQHHVGLGPDGSQIGLMLAPGYRRAPQRDGGSNEFGGENDLVSLPGHSRWTQDDFTGGMYADIWGKDPAMYHHSESFRPLPHSRGLTVVPPFVDFSLILDDIPVYPHLSVGATWEPILSFRAFSFLYIIYPQAGEVLKVDLTGVNAGEWTSTDLGVTGNKAAYHREDNVLYICDDTNKKLHRFRVPTLVAATTPFYSYPTGVGNRPLTGINADGPRITCCFGKFIADLTIPESGAVGATSKQWTVNRRYHLPSKWRNSLYYNNQLYILCTDETDPTLPFSATTGWRSEIVAWDGADLYPVVDFPYAFQGRAITEYAGRLFVGGAGVTPGGENNAAELYEITGSSLRLVRSWADDSGRPLSLTLGPTSINDLVVWEGFLAYYNDIKERVDLYDITTDAFYQIGGASVGAGLAYHFLHPFGDTLGIFGQVPATGDALERGNAQVSRIAIAGDVFTAHLPVVQSSTFAFEPARDKRWSELAVLTRGAKPEQVQFATTTSGVVLTELSSVTTGDWITTRYDLSALEKSPTAHARVRFSVSDTSPRIEIHAFSASFLLLPSGKKAWQVTVIGAENIEGVDRAKIAQDVSDISTKLLGWHEDGDTLKFTDLDGVVRNVRVYDFDETQIEIGPSVVFGAGTRREATFGVTLVEV